MTSDQFAKIESIDLVMDVTTEEIDATTAAKRDLLVSRMLGNLIRAL